MLRKPKPKDEHRRFQATQGDVAQQHEEDVQHSKAGADEGKGRKEQHGEQDAEDEVGVCCRTFLSQNFGRACAWCFGPLKVKGVGNIGFVRDQNEG